jgi:N-acetylglucosaminyl-diphospho-decaprenol L-rhamnosyltransferase
MTISILIVNWKSKDFVRQCIRSIDSDTSIPQPQIVVVDGGSFDGCREMLEQEFPTVEFVQSYENLGFGGSNNLGFSRVTGEAVLLLNPDTEIRLGSLQVMLEELERVPKAGLIGPRLLNSDGSLQKSCVQALPTPINQFLDSEFLRRMFPDSRLWGNGLAFRSNGPTNVEAVSGACMLLRRSTFQTVGGFDSQYFMYGEDMDLCRKIQSVGLNVVHLPSVAVVHHGGGSTSGEVSNLSVQMMRESIYRFIRSHQGFLAAAAYRILMAVSASLRIMLLAPAMLIRRDTKRIQKWVTVLRWSFSRGSQGKSSRAGQTPQLNRRNASEGSI